MTNIARQKPVTKPERLPKAPYSTAADCPVQEGHDDPDSIVLLTADGRNFTKTFLTDGTERPRDFTKLFDSVEVRSIKDMPKLESLLIELNDRPHAVVIRGAMKKRVKPPFPRTSSGINATFVDAPRAFLMVDIDGSDFHLPPDWMDHPESVAKGIIEADLPKAFHKAGCIVQWSSSMGVKPDTVKVHLWFLLERPLWSIEAKNWLEGRCDISLFQPVQQHYTAAPIFIGPDQKQGFFTNSGGPDPSLDPLIGERVFRIEGPRVKPPRVIASSPRRGGLHSGDSVGSNRFDEILTEIGDHEVGRGLHGPIRDLCLSYVSSNHPNDDRGWLRGVVKDRLKECDLKGRSPEELENRVGYDLDHSYDTAVTMVERSPNRFKPRKMTPEEIEKMKLSLEQQDAAPNDGFDTSFFDA